MATSKRHLRRPKDSAGFRAAAEVFLDIPAASPLDGFLSFRDPDAPEATPDPLTVRFNATGSQQTLSWPINGTPDASVELEAGNYLELTYGSPGDPATVWIFGAGISGSARLHIDTELVQFELMDDSGSSLLTAEISTTGP